ncbi:hypothetical protein RUND412_004925 [Rhizina undulata]
MPFTLESPRRDSGMHVLFHLLGFRAEIRPRRQPTRHIQVIRAKRIQRRCSQASVLLVAPSVEFEYLLHAVEHGLDRTIAVVLRIYEDLPVLEETGITLNSVVSWLAAFSVPLAESIGQMKWVLLTVQEKRKLTDSYGSD